MFLIKLLATHAAILSNLNKFVFPSKQDFLNIIHRYLKVDDQMSMIEGEERCVMLATGLVRTDEFIMKVSWLDNLVFAFVALWVS